MGIICLSDLPYIILQIVDCVPHIVLHLPLRQWCDLPIHLRKIYFRKIEHLELFRRQPLAVRRIGRAPVAIGVEFQQLNPPLFLDNPAHF